jgi:cytochrome b561
MSLKNTTVRYGSLAIALHWLMLVLIVGVYSCMELREFFPKGSAPREALKTWHFMLGISVFFLVWLRLAVRIISPKPRIVPVLPHWQARLSGGVHVALYFLMIATPLLGWLMVNAFGKPVPFFGFELPMLIGENKELAKTIKERHEFLANLGYFLIAIHAAAALFHHFIVRDNTLVRMLPSRE